MYTNIHEIEKNIFDGPNPLNHSIFSRKPNIRNPQHKKINESHKNHDKRDIDDLRNLLKQMANVSNSRFEAIEKTLKQMANTDALVIRQQTTSTKSSDFINFKVMSILKKDATHSVEFHLVPIIQLILTLYLIKIVFTKLVKPEK